MKHPPFSLRAAGAALLAFAVFAAAALPARADLVGLWTFSRGNPLEAKVGPDALEATGRRSLATSAATNALYAVTDAAVLGGRAGVLAAPVDAGIALPIAGNLSGTWCLAFDFYVPAQASWVSFFQLDQSNSGDSKLYLKNGTQIGLGQYETVGTVDEVVGSWHQLVVSMDGGTGYVWYDGTKLPQQRSWSLASLSWIILGIDGGGDNALVCFDEARLYDEARPADVFPDGENAAVFAPDADSGAPFVALGTVTSRYGTATLPVSVLSPGDDACSLVATIVPDGGGAARTVELAASAAAGSRSFEIDDLGWADGASGTVSVTATGLSRGRAATSATRAFRFSTTGTSASLVGHWTFSRANPLEAKVGGDALEGTGRSPVATSATTNALYAVTDEAVLGDRVGVLALPKGAGALLPVPSGLSDTWCFSFDFYVPDYFSWFSFFSLKQDNDEDGYLFLRSGTDIGRGQYQTLSSLVGGWHQLAISMDGGSGYVWVDGTKLAQQRSWSLASAPFILLSMDNDGDDNLLYFDEARLYDEAYPADVFPDGASASVYAPDRDDGTPSVALSAVSFADGALTLSVAVSDPGDAACSLAALVAQDGGEPVSIPLAASAGGGARTFTVAFSGAPGVWSASVVATGLSRHKTATTSTLPFYVTDAAAAVFGETSNYVAAGQRITATGSLESLGEGDNTLYLFATGADGAVRTLASQPAAAAGSFSLTGVFPGTGTVDARVVCSNSADAVVWHVAGLPAATLALGADTSRYYRAAGTAPDAAWNDPAAWTGGGVNNAGFPTADGQAGFAAAGAATTRLPAGSWTAGEMHFENAGVTNVFAGEGKDVSFLDTSMWFRGEGVFLGISNATFRCDNFGFRRPDMTIRVDGGRLSPTAQVELHDANGPRARLELVNGGLVETYADFVFGAEDSVLFVDGGAFRSQGSLRIANGPSTIDVAVPETHPSEAPVSVASISGTGNVAFTVNVVENRSKTPGFVPVLACAGGIPDGLVELGSVPYPERGERLFFGYDGTSAETGALRTGVWYFSNPGSPTVLIVR